MSEDSESTVTRSSALTRSSTLSYSNDHKKRKRNASKTSEIDKPVERTNKSHTAYFFRKATDDNEIAYCVLCKENFQIIKNPILIAEKEDQPQT